MRISDLVLVKDFRPAQVNRRFWSCLSEFLGHAIYKMGLRDITLECSILTLAVPLDDLRNLKHLLLPEKNPFTLERNR